MNARPCFIIVGQHLLDHCFQEVRDAAIALLPEMFARVGLEPACTSFAPVEG